MPKVKKIKDLTIEELVNLCDKYPKGCNNCPIYKVKEVECYLIIGFAEEMKEKINEEIEVE